MRRKRAASGVSAIGRPPEKPHVRGMRDHAGDFLHFDFWRWTFDLLTFAGARQASGYSVSEGEDSSQKKTFLFRILYQSRGLAILQRAHKPFVAHRLLVSDQGGSVTGMTNGFGTQAYAEIRLPYLFRSRRPSYIQKGNRKVQW